MVVRIGRLIVTSAVLLSFAAPAQAGMPSFHLSDLAAIRLQGISFFLVGLLLSALAIQLLWNYLAKEFTRLPRLNYPRACGVVVLWGLLFVIVLTMISGARELMTPGAWTRRGVTYQLAPGEEAAPEEDAAVANAYSSDDALTQLAKRRLQLADLRLQLERFALEHDGAYPASIEESGIDESLWKVPDTSGLIYEYVGARTQRDRDLPLVFEPAYFECDPLVLLVGGDIVRLPRDRIEQSLASAARQRGL